MRAFVRRLAAELKFFLAIAGTGAFLILLSIGMLAADSRAEGIAEDLSFWGYRLLVAGYPLFVFVRIILWLLSRSLAERKKT